MVISMGKNSGLNPLDVKVMLHLLTSNKKHYQ
jgi:hypothetical protein